MSAPIKVGLPGFGGRMGQMIARLIQEDSSFELVAATETLNSKLIGRDISHNLGIPKTGITISSAPDILGNSSDVIIDFTQPEATMERFVGVHGTQPRRRYCGLRQSRLFGSFLAPFHWARLNDVGVSW